MHAFVFAFSVQIYSRYNLNRAFIPCNTGRSPSILHCYAQRLISPVRVFFKQVSLSYERKEFDLRSILSYSVLVYHMRCIDCVTF